MTKAQLTAKLSLLRRTNKAQDQTEIENLQKALADYDVVLGHEAQEKLKKKAEQKAEYESQKGEVVLTPEALRLINDLKAQMTATDIKKAQLHDEMLYIADAVNCKNHTSQILELREHWRQLGDQVRHLYKHGVIAPEDKVDEGLFNSLLPSDIFELRYKLKTAYSHRKKLSDAFDKAKNLADKYEKEKALVKKNIEIQLMQSKLRTLKA